MRSDPRPGLRLTSVGGTSLLANVSAQLRDAIARGDAPPGSRLPTEAELTTRFGVSRTVVREAIAHLRAEGLVVAYQGKGMYVTSSAAPNVLRLADARHDQRSLARLFELRAVVEVGAAEVAARHREPADLAQMRQALATMRRAIDSGDGSLAASGADGDVAFHYAIARATQNPYFGEVLDFLRARFRGAIARAWANSRAAGHGPVPAYAEHLKMFEAIEAGDARAAARAARNHLDRAARRLGFERGVSGPVPSVRKPAARRKP